jgi:hypothetical protein
MLYQLCTGKLPFEADTPMAIALKHVNEPLPRPREVNPNLPEAVDAVLIRALAKDRDLRYASMGELNEAFQKALAEGLENGPSRTRSGLFDRSTQLYEKYQSVTVRPWYRRRAPATAAVILGLLMCPLSAWAMSAVLPGFNGASAESTAQVYVWTPTGWAATILALNTANAPAEGTELPPGAIFTAVAATMQAMRIPLETATVEWTPTSTTGGAVPQGTPSPTRTLRPGETQPTSTRVPPTSTVPTSTDNPTDPPTPTSPPTNTPEPTNPPPPTNTPSPPTQEPTEGQCYNGQGSNPHGLPTCVP